MAAETASPAFRRIRQAVARSAPIGSGDGELLDRFITAREEYAFEQLVRAHGPMVLATCERLLGNRTDAEDAFQATFLVLARKAASIRCRASVAGWLYAIACLTSLEARAMRTRRRRVEGQVEPLPDLPGRQPPDVSELRAMLDCELSQLGDRYRSAIVLCDLEGLSRADTAQRLGIPEGTLSSRLAMGRRKLAARLARRGFALSSATLTAALPQVVRAAIVPTPLFTATVRSAFAFTSSPVIANSVSAPVATLTQGALKAMFITRVKLSALLLLPLAVVVAVILGADQPRCDAAPTAGTVVAAANIHLLQVAALENEEQKGKGVRDARPVVVKTVPQAGDDAVDPDLKEIRATFSKDMEDGNWSWTTAEEGDYPKTTGKISYDKDKRTCVLPVKLEPGKTYACWLNSQNFHNFKDTDGRPAVPYLLVFQTKKK
jgi:RNA polymerase sigma-70 factor (ECF subfamily)